MKRVAATAKKYFIPHEGNDHAPHILRSRTVFFVSILALSLEAVFLISSTFIIPRSKLFGLIITNALIDGTNDARIAGGLTPLRENALLDLAAQEKANDMVANDYFAHTSPAGVTPWYWFAKAGYDFSSAGENLAVNFADSSDVTNAWLNSPEHRANIMGSGYADIGMATAQGEFNGHPAIYVVELFGTPAASAAAAPIVKASAPPAAPTPVTAKPAPKSVPVTATDSGAAASPAVSGAETSSEATPAGVAAAAPAIVSVNSPLQNVAADPRRIVDYIYTAIALLFMVSLAIAMAKKVHFHHPRLVYGGMLVILIAGLFIVLNQHLGATNVVIL